MKFSTEQRTCELLQRKKNFYMPKASDFEFLQASIFDFRSILEKFQYHSKNFGLTCKILAPSSYWTHFEFLLISICNKYWTLWFFLKYLSTRRAAEPQEELKKHKKSHRRSTINAKEWLFIQQWAWHDLLSISYHNVGKPIHWIDSFTIQAISSLNLISQLVDI